jgi:hypothetical protein
MQPINRPPLRRSKAATRRAIGASGRACFPTTRLIVALTARGEEEVLVRTHSRPPSTERRATPCWNRRRQHSFDTCIGCIGGETCLEIRGAGEADARLTPGRSARL